VQLQGRQQALVVGVALGEPAGAHRVVVLPGAGPGVVDLELQGVVQQRQQAQLAPALAALPPLLDRS
jgi:hypothetical protein